MLVGYCRTSTVKQVAGFEAQERELRATGAEKLFLEQVSSVAERKQLEAAIDFVREGDALVVTRLDRLARSVKDLMTILARLKAKKVSVRILNIGFDTSTPTGKMMLTMLGAVAEFEREIMLERQREGIAKAQREGKYKGQKPVAEMQTDRILELARTGMIKQAIATELKISIRSVFRILAETKGTQRQAVQQRNRPRAA